MKKLYEKKPVIFVLVMTAITFVVILLSSVVEKYLLNHEWDTYLQGAIAELIIMVYGIFICFYFGHKYVYKFKASNFFKGWIPGLYYIIMGLYQIFYLLIVIQMWDYLGSATDTLVLFGMDLSDYVVQPAFHVICFTVMMVMVGVAEESIFRGLIAERLIKGFGSTSAGIKKAVVLSGVLFGFLHLVNGISTGFVSSLVQSIIASLMGMILAVIYFKSKSLWSVIFLHAFIDFSALAMRGGIYGSSTGDTGIMQAMEYSAMNLIGIVPLVIVLLVLLRKKNIAIIAENYSLVEDESVTNVD